MARQKFIDLIVNYCALVGGEQAARIVVGCPVVFGDIRFSVIQSDEIDPDSLFIYCNFGEVPGDLDDDAYRTLLRVNLSTYAGMGLSMKVSAETGYVYCAARYQLDEITPEQLQSVLTALAVNALAWRKNYFLSCDLTSTHVP